MDGILWSARYCEQDRCVTRLQVTLKTLMTIIIRQGIRFNGILFAIFLLYMIDYLSKTPQFANEVQFADLNSMFFFST